MELEQITTSLTVQAVPATDTPLPLLLLSAAVCKEQNIKPSTAPRVCFALQAAALAVTVPPA